ncbi:NADH-quinone oxidoreductase subunit NuoB [Dehalobacter sp. DCM]|uniref:NADH-quinone oxidoreductase subunit NuoB n=1 Tax=Dehalobacter sp. DCM TaxID=2907827 RepID=UPI0030820508|nr:NADH-quinone oxidoreductase subunit NuoB [Dehalobacter sp. DCM]
MFNTLKKIIQYPRLTQEYPKIINSTANFIGQPVIHPERCCFCGACAQRCPSQAIAFDGAARRIGINYDQCVFCVLCEDVCQSGAIRMTHCFELAERSRAKLRPDGSVLTESAAAEPNTADAKPTLVIHEADVPAMADEALTGELKKHIMKVFGRSLQIREVDSGSCNACDYEINALNNPVNDIERLGISFVASPRHADMLLVTGTATRNMQQALVKTYQATPDPKLVVAVGACACSGGIFRDSYATNNGIDSLIPVDVYIPGCPPRPQAIIYGILKALERVE